MALVENNASVEGASYGNRTPHLSRAEKNGGFNGVERELVDLLSKLNPLAEEFIPQPYRSPSFNFNGNGNFANNGRRARVTVSGIHAAAVLHTRDGDHAGSPLKKAKFGRFLLLHQGNRSDQPAEKDKREAVWPIWTTRRSLWTVQPATSQYPTEQARVYANERKPDITTLATAAMSRETRILPLNTNTLDRDDGSLTNDPNKSDRERPRRRQDSKLNGASGFT